VWLVGDVRLDGREDLRNELAQSGESVALDVTDEELILQVWRRWGEVGLARLAGDLSFALWDRAACEVVCMRDLTGFRPFFYAHIGKWLLFSNTLRVLRMSPGVSRTIDPEFIADLLLQDWSSDPSRTVYKQIRRLAPGHLLKYSEQGLCVRRHTEIPIEEPLWLERPEEYIERFQSLLESAVRDRLPDRSSAVFLSGGLDSTSVAAVARKIAGNSEISRLLRAYSVDCRPLFDDQEGILASRVAEHLGLDIQIAFRDSWLPYEGWGDPQFATPEPIHDPFLAFSLSQSRQVSPQARVALRGYGGDDVLTGQAWPFFLYLLQRRRFGTIASTFGGYVLTHKRIPPLRGGFRARLGRWMSRTDPLSDFPRWLEPHFVAQFHLRDHWLELRRLPEMSHPLHPIGYAGLSSDSRATLLETEDAAWTGVPVETRTPLLDLRLLRFLLRVPPVPWCMDKELLRQAMRGMLPEEIRSRPKTPLAVDPLDTFVQNKRWSPLPLLEPPAELRAYVDWQRLDETLKTATGSTLWSGLRPISLGHWLVVENQG
jgi:asparagine synthase (glutamine-hydrolysing)